MRTLLCLMLLATPLFAQEEPAGGGEEGPAESEHPGSDSPEAQHARKYDGPRKRVQAFLIPMDEAARAATTRVAQAVEGVLSKTPVYEVVDLGRALSVESTAEQASAADEGRKAVSEGNLLAAGKGWPEAAGKYQKALKAYDRGLPAVGAREYAEALLRYGAAEWMSGEEKQAKDAFALCARLDPQQKLEPGKIEAAIEPHMQAAYEEAKKSKPGSLEIETRPAGARVILDGESKGHAPVKSMLATGKHLLRVERAGFFPYAELIDVSPKKPVSASITLSATPSATNLNTSIAGAAGEVAKGSAGKNVAALAEKFSLDRVLIGSVRSDEGKASVLLALVDAQKRKVIASKSLLLITDGTDADQVEADSQGAMRKLISQDGMPEDGAAAAPVAAAKPAAADAPAERRMVMPGTMPAAAPQATADDPGLVAKEPARHVVQPAPAADAPATDAPAPASTAAVQEEKKQQDSASKKKKGKGLKGKTGTEDWDDE